MPSLALITMFLYLLKREAFKALRPQRAFSMAEEQSSFMKSSSYAFQLSTFQSYNSERSRKYGGILQSTWYKALRHDLGLLFSYIYSVSRSFSLVHSVITVIRLIQAFGPSFFPKKGDVWGVSSVTGTMRFLSFFYTIVVPGMPDSVTYYFVLAYVIQLALALAFTIAASKYFKKNAKLPSILSTLISFYYATLGQILPPMALNSALRVISSALFLSNQSVGSVIISVSCILLTCFFLWTLMFISNQTLVFRPISLMSATITPQNYATVFIVVCNCIEGFVTELPKKSTCVMVALMAVMYFLALKIPFTRGGFISNIINIIFISICISGCLNSVIVFIHLLVDQQVKLPTFFSLLILFGVVTILTSFYIRSRAIRNTIKLDEFMEDDTSLNSVTGFNTYVDIVMTGLRLSHPTVTDLSLFRYGVEKWPKEADSWYIFAKFAAIYPEEIQTLAWIFQSIVNLKIHGLSARCIKEQSIAISRQRETNLSPDLKSKLNNLQKHIQSTKHKLSRIWDVSLQGNVGEVEAVTKSFSAAQEQNDADFQHLIRQFPNNRFVTRAYSRFLQEVMASETEAYAMNERSKLLQRGISVIADSAQDLGLKCFPLLPEKLKVSGKTLIQSQTNSEVASTMQVETETYDVDMALNSNQDRLRNMINDLKIPSIRSAYFMRMFLLITLVCLTSFLVIYYLVYFVSSLIEPLEHILSLARIRTYVCQIVSFSDRLIYTDLGAYSPFIYDPENTVDSLGGSWDMKDMLRHILDETSKEIQGLAEFRTFESSNPLIQQAHKILFTPELAYTSYISLTESKVAMLTVQGALSDFIMQLIPITSKSFDISANPSITTSSTYLNPFMNYFVLATALNDALSAVVDYIQYNHDSTSQMVAVVLYIIISIDIVAFMGTLLYQVLSIRRDKTAAYRCLTSLPKNTVSALSENLRSVKKKMTGDSSSTKSDMNKQEENVVKIFNTGRTISNSISDLFFIIVGTVLIAGLTIAIAVISYNSIIDESLLMVRSSPHVHYIYGAYSNALIAHFSLTNIGLIGTPYETPIMSLENLTGYLTRSIDRSAEYWNYVRYGGDLETQKPFAAFQAISVYSASRMRCTNKYRVSSIENEVIKCFDPDIVFASMCPIILQHYVNFVDLGTPIDYSSEVLTTLFERMIYPLHETLFYPMLTNVIPTIDSELKENQKGTIILVSLLTGLAVIIEAVMIYHLSSIDKHIRSVLKLLLFCEPSLIYQMPRIMSVLGGEFSVTKTDSTTRHEEFFAKVVESLLDAVFTVDVTQTIKTCNKSCKRILNFDEEDIAKGFTVSDLFNKEVFSGNISSIISPTGLVSTTLEYKAEDGIKNLLVNVVVYNHHFIYNVTDTTASVRYQSLINQERSRSDSLLSSILPISLIARVQSGEKNISFSVQSATILFIDIVQFTPWCSSLPAATVMSTLNLLFKKLDARIAVYQTMTKIKCIGDCYMAAAGIFSDVSNPSLNSREAVLFALDALDIVKEINSELNEKLQIRAGINTGGPIVAGVLGIGKPTFEILGPAINLAQQMEHTGVPSCVQISRSVYELIYGESFKIKEKGQTEIKGGSVLTYLVTRD